MHDGTSVAPLLDTTIASSVARAATDPERARIAEGTADQPGRWWAFGPYVSERAWGTVREDYSADGRAWEYLPHDHARSRAYRWSEDGLAGMCDVEQRLCFALAFWNGRDPILKERIFGLTGTEGNHGEDAKEYWWYVDATPTASWLRWRYHYPHEAFPYAALVSENRRRTRADREFELQETGIFAHGYWAITADYAKATPDDICVRVNVRNAGTAAETLHVLPTLWFRNRWSWDGTADRPVIRAISTNAAVAVAEDPVGGTWILRAGSAPDGTEPTLLFCENETNFPRFFGSAASTPYPKDGINDHVVHGAPTVNPSRTGTKMACWYRITVPAGETVELRLRLARAETTQPFPDLGPRFERVLIDREREADAFYAPLRTDGTTDEEAAVMRRGFAGLVWSQQFYHYDVERWLDGDAAQPTPPTARRRGRNAAWRHLDSNDVLVMPDKWEYPWYAAWDLGFHCVTLAHLNAAAAKHQLLLLCREWFMHPNGQLPAYEWGFGDVNPPVHAWAALRVHGRVHVAEAPLVSRQLPVRVHEPLTAEKQQLVLGGRRVEMRERDTVEAQIPCRVPRVFPLVGHDEDVVAVEMPPGGVPSAPACRGRSRLRGIAVEPALDVVVVELLAPHEAGEAATHDRRLLVRGAVGAERSVEGVGLSLAVDQHPLETRTQIGERLRRLRACEPQPELHGFPGGHRDAIPARHLRAGLAGIHRRRAVHHVVVDAILRIRRARRRSEEAREVRLVLAEEQGRLCPIGRRAGTQYPCTADGVLRDCDGGGRGDRADHGSIGSPVPGPPIAKPQGREDVQHRLLRARVADLQPDADVVRSCLGVVGGDRPVAVRKDAGFLKLELAVGARPAPVLR